MSIRKVTTAASDGDEFLDELRSSLTSVLGPFRTRQFKPTVNPGIGVSVMACKIGKGPALIAALHKLGFTTIDKSAAYMFGGTHVDDDGAKTFVNYTSMAGVLVVGTSITKEPVL